MNWKRIGLSLILAGMLLALPACKKNQPQATVTDVAPTYHAVNQGVDFTGWNVTLLSHEVTPEVKDDFFVTPAKEGQQFLILTWTAKNTGQQAAVFSALSGAQKIQAYLNSDTVYERVATMMASDLSGQTAAPGQSVTGITVFSIPKDASPSSLTIRITQQEEIEEWKLP